MSGYWVIDSGCDKSRSERKLPPLEGDCAHCKGSGDMKGIAGAGPDTYEIDVPCVWCSGTGSEPNVP